MPRAPRFTPLDLETYDGDLSVAQVCELAADAGFVLEARTLHRWLRLGYVPGYHPHPMNREWRLTIDTARRVISKLRKRAHAA